VLAASALFLLAPCAREEEGCPPGQADCGGTCVDLLGDEANCGSCGHACAAGQTCSSGLCCDEGLVNCAGSCVDLQADGENCGTCGLACGLGTCQTGDCVCLELPTVENCGRDPVCVDTAVDEAHCGECENACGANYDCQSGGCLCPDPPFLLCGTDCADPETDERHCGGCDRPCASGATCADGGCHCPDGEEVCGTPPGTCVDTRTDGSHCGSCGNACEPGERCCGGTCADTSTDEANCGSCGNPCDAGESCTASLCCTTGLPVCGAECCSGGTACCDGDCPYPHQNGLGQSYFSCTPTFTYTRAAAEEAARAWRDPGTAVETVAFCAVDCLGWQTPDACAVWCYGTTQLSGYVRVNEISLSCDAACPYDLNRRWE
jgi:hypothetical protein